MQKDKFLQRRNYRRVSKTALAIALCLVIFVTNTGVISAADAPSSWAAEQVNAAIAEGLVPPNLQSNYTNAITRAEFATLVVVMYEKVKGEILAGSIPLFVDTDDFKVQKAAWIGVVAGVGNDRFAPNDTLTREQAAVMLSRLTDKLNNPLPRQTATFADNAEVSEWAIDSVGNVQASGIMSGVGNNNFSPKGSYTREQSIITIVRMFSMIWPAVTEESVYNTMMAMQSEYPEGMRWTNGDRYYSNDEDWYRGCGAFAMILQDAAFGHRPSKIHHDFDRLKVGDIVALISAHAWIVLQIDGDTVTVAEGNANSSIHWGDTHLLSFWKKETEKYEIWTRW